MDSKVYIFLALCFFTQGILCLMGILSLCLNYFFKVKAYTYYFGYILAIIVFISMVFVIHGKVVFRYSYTYYFSKFFYDTIQITIFYLHTLFIYHAMVLENEKFKKLKKIINIYSAFVCCHVLLSLFFNDLRFNPVFYASSRLFILFISLFIFAKLAKELSNIYFRFLFVACSILMFFSLLAFWDSTINVANSTFRGFQFICMGYLLENLCFLLAFIYRIITVYNQNRDKEIFYEKQLASVQIEIQHQTMKHIGREIHDNVGQKLTLASLYTQQLGFENLGKNINDKISGISNIINQSLTELRILSKTLSNSEIENNSIVALLKQEFDRVANLKNYTVNLNINVGILKLSYQAKSVILRVTQEFLQNSIKHANCKIITASLDKIDNKLIYILTDDGKGFDIDALKNTGIGLVNMQSRIELLGGKYLIESDKNGTKLFIELIV